MKKLFLFLTFAFTCSLIIAQTPFQFNFQAVARDLAGNPMVNEDVDFRLSILQGSEAGAAIFVEDQNVQTNNFGLANLLVGSGTPVTGTLDAVDWAVGPFFLQIELDINDGQGMQLMGVSPMTSVPYALHALTTEEPGPEGPQGLQGEIGPQGEPGDDGLDGIGIAQTLSQTGSDVTLSDGGGSVNIDDADADPMNELQDISLSVTDLSISNGSTVDLSSLQDGTGTDDQNIFGSGLAGTDLTIGIEGGSSETVDLSALQDGTGTDDQTLNLAGNILNIETGNSVDLTGYLDNTDAQALSVLGSDLSISGGNTVTIPNDDDWTVNGADIYNSNAGNVGIGLGSPSYKLHVQQAISGTAPIAGIINGHATGDGVLRLTGGATHYSIGSDATNGAFKISNSAFGFGGASDRFTILNGGNVGIGTSTPEGALDVSSTTSGVIMPRMTQVQRDAIATAVDGMMLYNTDENCMNVFQAGAWESLCGGGSSGSSSGVKLGFSETTSWTCPDGVTQVTVELWGGSGGGGASSGFSYNSATGSYCYRAFYNYPGSGGYGAYGANGGWGGSGGYDKQVISVTPGETYDIVVGAGGIGGLGGCPLGVNSGTDGEPGEASNFELLGAILVSADGGGGAKGYVSCGCGNVGGGGGSNEDCAGWYDGSDGADGAVINYVSPVTAPALPSYIPLDYLTPTAECCSVGGQAGSDGSGCAISSNADNNWPQLEQGAGAGGDGEGGFVVVSF